MSSITQVRREDIARARLARHKRVFQSGRLAYVTSWVLWVKESLHAVTDLLQNRAKSAPKLIPWEARKPVHTSEKLFRQLIVFSIVIAMASPFLPVNAYEGFDENISGTFIVDSEGYLSKSSPLTYFEDRSDMTDKAQHSIASGETLSSIAAQYGVKQETILWENSLTDPDRLRVGQSLTIPPIDGVNHTVRKGENLEKVAKMYSVDKSLIVKQNNLQTDTLTEGNSIFVPGGRRLIADISRESLSRTGTISGTRYMDVPRPAPSAPGRLIWPTRGKLTQGVRRGHYAFDIADPSKPPVWAAAAGKVEKINVGNWGGGYGNHIVIDHGNGLKTLYAHLNTVNVKEGQVVDQGSVLGQMGRTGRVYGRTGIHVHFEVMKNGVKQVPSKFF